MRGDRRDDYCSPRSIGSRDDSCSFCDYDNLERRRTNESFFAQREVGVLTSALTLDFGACEFYENKMKIGIVDDLSKSTHDEIDLH